MIIGIVYTLAISSFDQIKENKKALTLKNLKEYLNQYPHEKSVELLCLDDCSSCELLIDDEIQKELHGKFDGFLDDSVKVYRYEYDLGTVDVEPKAYFNSEDVEEEVCFSYSVDKKGIGEQVLVEFNGFVYDFTTYFTETTRYDSIEEAVEAKNKLSEDVLK